MASTENQLMVIIGAIMMVAGAVIVFTVFALYRNDPNSTQNVAIGAALTLLGWLLQRFFSRRKDKR